MQATVCWRLVVCALLSPGLCSIAGCTATSQYMRPVPGPVPFHPPAGQALVVFVRPSAWASAVKVTIFNHQGLFLGDSLPESHFAVALPPGPHVFISWAENTAALQAHLAADRTYFVEVAPKLGAFSPRCHLLAITPRTESWGRLQGWLARTQRLEADFHAGQAYLASRGEETAERLRRGHEVMAGYDAAERSERTLRPEDGVARPPTPFVVLPVAPPPQGPAPQPARR